VIPPEEDDPSDSYDPSTVEPVDVPSMDEVAALSPVVEVVLLVAASLEEVDVSDDGSTAGAESLHAGTSDARTRSTEWESTKR
jgi:hypothetical protein